MLAARRPFVFAARLSVFLDDSVVASALFLLSTGAYPYAYSLSRGVASRFERLDLRLERLDLRLGRLDLRLDRIEAKMGIPPIEEVSR